MSFNFICLFADPPSADGFADGFSLILLRRTGLRICVFAHLHICGFADPPSADGFADLRICEFAQVLIRL